MEPSYQNLLVASGGLLLACINFGFVPLFFSYTTENKFHNIHIMFAGLLARQLYQGMCEKDWKKFFFPILMKIFELVISLREQYNCRFGDCAINEIIPKSTTIATALTMLFIYYIFQLGDKYRKEEERLQEEARSQ